MPRRPRGRADPRGLDRAVLGAEAPVVDRVEPPSWWVTGRGTILTLVIEGSGLRGAEVSADREGVEPRVVHERPDGSALLVDLILRPSAGQGVVNLRFEAGGEARTVPWPILPDAGVRPSRSAATT